MSADLVASWPHRKRRCRPLAHGWHSHLIELVHTYSNRQRPITLGIVKISREGTKENKLKCSDVEMMMRLVYG